MPTATTIVVAREDFSIPGGDPAFEGAEPPVLEALFFGLLRDSKPDVAVLDLTRANGEGVETIRRIRRRSAVPILAVCGREAATDYRMAGAAACIVAPVDVVAFNRALQQVIRGSRAADPAPETELDRSYRLVSEVSVEP